MSRKDIPTIYVMRNLRLKWMRKAEVIKYYPIYRGHVKKTKDKENKGTYVE